MHKENHGQINKQDRHKTLINKIMVPSTVNEVSNESGLAKSGFITVEAFSLLNGLPVKSVESLARSKKGGIIQILSMGGRDVVNEVEMTQKFTTYSKAESVFVQIRLSKARQIAKTQAAIIKAYILHEEAIKALMYAADPDAPWPGFEEGQAKIIKGKLVPQMITVIMT